MLLKADHQELRRAFRAFDKSGERATKRKGDLVERMIELLTVHTYLENEVMYPEVRRLVPVLIENVEHHIEEEEGEWFPKVRAALGRKQLSELGQRMLDAKEKAPRSPAAPSALKKAIDAVVK